jgi:hypothetical protein
VAIPAGFEYTQKNEAKDVSLHVPRGVFTCQATDYCKGKKTPCEYVATHVCEGDDVLYFSCYAIQQNVFHPSLSSFCGSLPHNDCFLIFLCPITGRGCGIKREKSGQLVDIRKRMGERGPAVLICVAHAASEAARRGYMSYQNNRDANGIPIPKNGTVEFKHPRYIEKKMCRACWQQLKTNGVRDSGRVQAGALRMYERCAVGNSFSREYFKNSLDSSFWDVILSDHADAISASIVSRDWGWLLDRGMASDISLCGEMGLVIEKMTILFSTNGVVDSRHVTYANTTGAMLSIDMPHLLT